MTVENDGEAEETERTFERTPERKMMGRPEEEAMKETSKDSKRKEKVKTRKGGRSLQQFPTTFSIQVKLSSTPEPHGHLSESLSCQPQGPGTW